MSMTQALQLFGLSEREAKVYLKLASSGQMRASELAKELRMHRLDTYHALKNLETKEMVEATLSRPMRFEALPLEEVIEIIKFKDREEARKKSDAYIQLEEASKKLAEISDKKSASENRNSDRIQILSGRRTINEKWLKIISFAEREILIVATDKGVVHSLLSRTFETLQRKLREGLNVKVFTPITQLNVKQIEGIRKGARHLTTSASAGLCIVDGNKALIVTEPSTTSFPSTEREESAILTNSRSIVQTLRTLFFVGWDTSPIFEDISEHV
jgi:sugar-specific transcriptional regulator TrmB